LITGAGRGIGKRLAIGFAAEGARVGLMSRTQAELDATKYEIEQTPSSGVLSAAGDVRDPDQMQRVVEAVTDRLGNIDVLIACAAIQGPVGPFLDSHSHQWFETFDTNLLGFMNACRAVLPQMIARRSGKVIAMIGDGVSSGRPNFALYAAANAAIARFVETVADEIRENNVQINCLNPGATYTSMTDEVLKAGDRAGSRELEACEQLRITGGIAAERQIRMALFLASERSNHVSGKVISVHDDLKRLTDENMRADSYTLRRLKS
jgi:NAD(P)-dependent dehydrogenase (short-subunit alcohol dehydrogenase family)